MGLMLVYAFCRYFTAEEAVLDISSVSTPNGKSKRASTLNPWMAPGFLRSFRRKIVSGQLISLLEPH